ncbi:Reverse transcriptase (RNA-dependent DNA polymerase) [Ceratobasidium sp. AG-Ba]|nr:Reverse transcriptase (RNA-dependent DNA polymerase) [Ceratobasidium sp. AG-Ba]
MFRLPLCFTHQCWSSLQDPHAQSGSNPQAAIVEVAAQFNVYNQADKVMNIFATRWLPISGSKILSCLNALSGITQMRVREEDQDKTAFICPICHYKFIRALAKYNWDVICIYIDGIIIFSKTLEKHLVHIGLVLAAIIKSGFTLLPKKCNFGFVLLLLLGHKVSRLGMSSHQEEVDAIVNMAEPRNKKELMTLNGPIVYYAWMIPCMAEIMALLFDLLKKETPWE